jgi:hypothetical protein
MRVRLAARQALFQYHLVGYRSGAKQEPTPDKNTGPALPGITTTSAKPPASAKIVVTPHGPFRETKEPPLAYPAVIPKRLPPVTPVVRPGIPVPAQAQFPPLPPPPPPSANPEPDGAGPALPPPAKG